jgi:hypothetical protein
LNPSPAPVICPCLPETALEERVVVEGAAVAAQV